MDKQLHLQRHRVGNLFLDTFVVSFLSSLNPSHDRLSGSVCSRSTERIQQRPMRSTLGSPCSHSQETPSPGKRVELGVCLGI